MRPDDRLPDIARPDVEAVVVNHWTVGSPERQPAAVDAIAAQWAQRSQPKALVSFATCTSTDGDAVLTYAQWTNATAKQETIDGHRAADVRALENGVPGLTPSAPVSYELYRSFIPDGAPPRKPGTAILAVNIEAAGAERARGWIDEVLAALGSEARRTPGSSPPTSTSAATERRSSNYAAWVNEQAHRDALENGPPRALGRPTHHLAQRAERARRYTRPPAALQPEQPDGRPSRVAATLAMSDDGEVGRRAGRALGTAVTAASNLGAYEAPRANCEWHNELTDH